MSPDITAAFIRQASNGYIVRASNLARETVFEGVYRTLDEAVDALAALAWAGEEEGAVS